MKIKKIALLALAASTLFVACNNDENGNPVSPEQAPKSVTIKLANVVTKTRNAGGDIIPAGTAVALSSYQIFFSDGTSLYQAKTADNQTPADQYIDVNDLVEGTLPDELSFHFLPAAVNKVIVIGNREELSVMTEAELDLALNLADEQNVEDLTLYATSQLTSKTPEHADQNPLYKANLTLAPTIARLYIKSFTCTFSGTPGYSSVSLKKMALNNYYTTNTLATNNLDGLTKQTISESTVWNWFAGLTPGFSNDDLSITLTPGDGTNTATSDLYYHFFPSAGTVPQLVVRAEGDGTPLYLATVNITQAGGTPVEWKAGTIYEMDFAFDVEDFDQPQKCIDVTVNPVDWVVVPVIPEF